MSYLPQVKSRIIGNDPVWHNLVNDCLTNSISHAYIFAGVKGIGKATMAKEFIKFILQCDEITSDRIDENNFLDLMLVEKNDKQEISIEKVRQLKDFFSHTPSECNYKFVIVDGAEDLNRNAANALLKILEEPTKNTFIILISHAPFKLLPTIRSRARIIKFKPLSDADLKLAANTGSLIGLDEIIAGSAEKAIENMDIDYQNYLDQITDLFYNKDILVFNDFCSKNLKIDKNWQAINEIINFIFLQLLKEKNAISQEDQRIKKIAANFSSSEIFSKYDESLNLLKQTEIFNLDKKQSLLQIINLL